MVILGGPNKWLPPPRGLDRAAQANRQYEDSMHYFTTPRINPASAGVDAHSGKTTTNSNKRRLATFAGLLLLPMLTGTALADAMGSGDMGGFAQQVKAANERFADVGVAKSEGYVPLPCASGTDGGSMGIHYVNLTLLGDPALDVAHPEAVLYEPQQDGSLKLMAVEYITEKGPSAALGGQLFNFTNSPNRYGLPPFWETHVWAWKANPMGEFADMNPDASCAFAPTGN
jgi:hypothetical protein